MRYIFAIVCVFCIAFSAIGRPPASIYGAGAWGPNDTILKCSSGSGAICSTDETTSTDENTAEEEEIVYDDWTHLLPPDDKTTYDDFIRLSKERGCQPVSRNHYQNCLLLDKMDDFMGFHKHLSCMHVIEKKDTCDQAGCSMDAPRRDLIGVASMLRGIGYATEFSCEIDIKDSLEDEPEWICQVIDGALKHDLISDERENVRPERTMTRSEAYSVLMKSICMDTEHISLTYYPETADKDWQKKVITLAIKYGFTVKDAYTFDPNDEILLQEFYTAASRIAAHAQRHGGCEPIKDQMCQ